MSSPRVTFRRFLSDLIAACTDNAIDVIIPTSEEVFWLAGAVPFLPKTVDIRTSSLPILEQLHHKVKFARLATSLGFGVPENYEITQPSVFSMFVSAFVPWETRYDSLWILPSVGFAILLLFIIVAIVRRVSWQWIALSALAPTAIFTFLSIDGPVLAMPDLGPRVGNDDPDFRTVMWFGKGAHSSRLRELSNLDETGDQVPHLPEDSAGWLQYVQTNRDSIKSAWQAISIAREWTVYLAGHPLHGVWHNSSGAPTLDFRAIRQLSYAANAYVYLLATEGETDRAIDVLMPVIRAMQNLQRTGPGILNSMITTVVLKQNYRVVEAILNRAALSERTRIALRSALENAPPIPDVMCNVFGGEIKFVSSVLDQTQKTGCALYVGSAAEQHRWINALFAAVSPFVFNRNHTLRLVADPLQEVETIGKVRNREGEKSEPHWPGILHQLGNPMGEKNWRDDFPVGQEAYKCYLGNRRPACCPT